MTLNEAKKHIDKYGNLILRGTKNTIFPDGLTIGGGLYLQGAKNITLSDGLSIGGSLDLTGAKNITLPHGLTVGGWLDLTDAENITLPDGLTVGGWLDLRDAKNITLPEGLTIGGWLELQSAENITLPEGLSIEKYWNTVKYLRNGDVVKNKYVYSDNILTLIKGEKRIGDYTFYIGRIPKRNVIYDGDNYAHCRSFKEGVLDLNFKKAKDRGAEQYQKYTLDSEVSHDEAVTMYRIITGACAAGTQQFIDNNPTKIKDKYTVREMIEITKGAYGGTAFADFFQRRSV